MRATVTFPKDPVVPFAGKTLKGELTAITPRRDVFPFLFQWEDPVTGHMLQRIVDTSWVQGALPPGFQKRRAVTAGFQNPEGGP